MIKITTCLVALFLIFNGCGQKEMPKVIKAKESFLKLKTARKTARYSLPKHYRGAIISLK